MAHQRTWKLHLNLDDFNAAYAALDDDHEKAQFLKGFSRGMNAGIARVDSTLAFQSGFDMGQQMRQEAEAYRNHQSTCGAKGGNPNLQTQGSVKGALRVGKGCLKGALRVGKGYVNPNPQSLILNPLISNPESVPPPTPSADAEGAVKSKSVRRRNSKSAFMTMFSPALAELVNSIIDDCPSKQPDGEAIRIDTALLADRLEGIQKDAPPELTDNIILQAWKDYIASRPKRFKAPQYFFGKQEDNGDGANWRPWARLAYHKIQKEQVGA